MKAIASSVALALAAVSPYANAVTCPTNMPVSVVLVSSFSCTLGDKTFTNFSATNVPLTAQVQFGQFGPLFTVTLSRDGVFFQEGVTTFDYTISAQAPLTIREASVGVDVSFPTELTVTTLNGKPLPSILNGGTDVTTFTPGVSSLIVDNTSFLETPFAQLNSLTNSFSQQLISVPEPSSLPLSILGLAGLGIALRRKWW